MNISITWQYIQGLTGLMQYVLANGNYYIFLISNEIQYTCVLVVGSSDAADFESNYKNTAINLV